MLLLLLLAAAPEQARYLFELDGVPVGTVQLSLDGPQYRYVSTHAYRRITAERADAFTLGAGKPTPEGYWLWHKPAAGCVDGITELSSQTGPLCAVDVGVREVTGTTLGKPFTARYDASNLLEELTLGPAHFVRTQRVLEAGKPYAKGFALEGKGKTLELAPAAEGTRWLSLAPRGTATKPLAHDDTCLEAARTFVAEHPGYRLALGVVVEKGRAYPHAWAVSETEGDVDPTAKLSKHKKPAPNTAYLELPRAEVAQLYLDLLEGKRRLDWK